MTYKVVGTSAPRVDGVEKVTGHAQFTEDVSLPNMLHGKILRSPYPHAKIVSIDTSAAESLPGVKAVITGKDTGAIRFGFVDTPRYPADQCPLAVEKVRYIGDEVAAVAAIDEITAAEALELIKVEYEVLPAVFEPEEALKDGAPRVHEEIVPTTTTAWEDWGVNRRAKTSKIANNICATTSISYGDIDRGFAQADHIREDRFVVPATAHAALEPHVVLASYDPSGRLDVWVTHMGVALKQYWFAKTMGLPINKVRVHRVFTGGAFGGKVSFFPYEFLAAFLSRRAGRPVRIVLSREEVFASCYVSNRFAINIKTGVKKDGAIVAQHTRLTLDAGAYRGSSSVAMFLAHAFRNAVHQIPNCKHEGVAIYTNKGLSGPKRGHGSPEMSFAVESQLDMIAKDLGMDSVAIRLRNIRKSGDVLPNGDRLDSCGLEAGIMQAVKATGWREKLGKGNGRGIGIGVSAMFNGSPYYPFASVALVRINDDGTATLFSGQSEFGQGAETALSQIAAEELKISLDKVNLVCGDSELCPIDLGGFLSNGIYVSGEAMRRAAADAKRLLLGKAAEILGANAEGLELDDGQVYVKQTPDRRLSFAQIVHTSIQSQSEIIGKGTCKPVPEVEFYPSLAKGVGRFTGAYSFAVAVAEVEVDPLTGRVKVRRITVADDCGFAINPAAVYGQLLGQAVMAMGDVLFEEVPTKNGQVLSRSFDDYNIPGVFDAPEFVHIPINSIEPKGPFGGKESGENSRAAVIAATANAISDAAGVRINSLPMTPDKIIAAWGND